MMNCFFQWQLALGLSLAFVVSASAESADHLVHQWTFNGNSSEALVDRVGGATLELSGMAWARNGALFLGGRLNSNYAKSSALGTPLGNRTLISWCSPANLPATGNCSGSVLSLVDPDQVYENGWGPANIFDGIVMGERISGQWMAGSEYYNRTVEEGNGGAIETQGAPGRPVMLAIVYTASPASVTIYRDGVPYAHTEKAVTGLPTLGANTYAVFGPRTLGSNSYFEGYILEARVYDAALTAEEIAEICEEGPVPANMETYWCGGFESNNPWMSIDENGGADIQGFPFGWYRDPRHVGLAFLAGRDWIYPSATEGECVPVSPRRGGRMAFRRRPLRRVGAAWLRACG